MEQQKTLNMESVKFMAETVRGSFAFTILDGSNVLWLVRGDSPLSLMRLPAQGLYVYASTDAILFKALVDTPLFDDVKRGNVEEMEVKPGGIVRLCPDGTLVRGEFDYVEDLGGMRWWDYGNGAYPGASREADPYWDDLKTVAAYQGYCEEDINFFLHNGFSLDEIEEFLYCDE